VFYLGFRNSMVPSGVVSWYWKSSVSNCLARSLRFVLSTIHPPRSVLIANALRFFS
jgi:hypothetical protein